MELLEIKIGCQHHNFATTRTSNGFYLQTLSASGDAWEKIAKKAKQKRGLRSCYCYRILLHMHPDWTHFGLRNFIVLIN